MKGTKNLIKLLVLSLLVIACAVPMEAKTHSKKKVKTSQSSKRGNSKPRNAIAKIRENVYLTDDGAVKAPPYISADGDSEDADGTYKINNGAYILDYNWVGEGGLEFGIIVGDTYYILFDNVFDGQLDEVCGDDKYAEVLKTATYEPSTNSIVFKRSDGIKKVKLSDVFPDNIKKVTWYNN